MTLAEKITPEIQEELERPIKVFGVIKFGYDKSYIMPHEDAINIMRAFHRAEIYQQSYSEPKKILPMTSSPEMTLLAEEDYLSIKVDTLLMPPEPTE